MLLSTTNWHMPSTSTRIKLHATAAADLQYPLKGVQGGEQKWGTLYSGKTGDFCSFCKNMQLIACTPPSQKSYIYWLFPYHLEQFLRAIWNAVSWVIVFILPQIKLNSPLSHCALFWSAVMVTMKGPRVDFSISPKLYKKPEPCFHERALSPICLLRESR